MSQFLFPRQTDQLANRFQVQEGAPGGDRGQRLQSSARLQVPDREFRVRLLRPEAEVGQADQR
jgi:hypothetical protein